MASRRFSLSVKFDRFQIICTGYIRAILCLQEIAETVGSQQICKIEGNETVTLLYTLHHQGLLYRLPLHGGKGSHNALINTNQAIY